MDELEHFLRNVITTQGQKIIGQLQELALVDTVAYANWQKLGQGKMAAKLAEKCPGRRSNICSPN